MAGIYGCGYQESAPLYYEKTFLDFFMIAGASHAYLLRGPHMMGSGFPYAAARIGGKECKTITF